MKKSQTQTADIARKRDAIDSSKQQYRCVVESARQLDDRQNRAASCEELFQAELVARRLRLAELCERLAFAQPTIYGKKAEEIMWRKAHYEVFTLAKRLRKDGSWSNVERALAIQHLLAGVGGYQRFLLRLQTDYELQLEGQVDLALPSNEEFLCSVGSELVEKTEAELAWARQAVVRCLIALGDLARYLADLSTSWSPAQASRFYLQALKVEPFAGMPHNQLGTLATSRNHHLDAVYHYMRCLTSAEKFEGAEANLRRAFQRSAADLQEVEARPASPSTTLRLCAARFLHLANDWFFDQTSNRKSHDTMLQLALSDIDQCLALVSNTRHSTENPGSSQTNLPPEEVIFKITATVLICVGNLSEKGSALLSTINSFGVGVLQRLVSRVLCPPPVQNKVLDAQQQQPPPTGKKKSWRGLRRRRAGPKKACSDESSEDEHAISYTVETDSGSSSDSHLESGTSSESEPEVGTAAPVETSPATEVPQVVLVCLRLLCDWLRGSASTLHAAVATDSALLTPLVYLLNVLISDFAEPGEDGLSMSAAMMVPLPEDVSLRGVAALLPAQTSLEWSFYTSNRSLRRTEEAVLRKHKLVNFGHFLVECGGLGVSFDPGKRQFSSSGATPSPGSSSEGEPCLESSRPSGAEHTASNGSSQCTNGSSGGEQHRVAAEGKAEELQRQLGRLWLRDEVNKLERSVRRREGAVSFSPYLVLDTEALLANHGLVRQMVASKKFLVIIPTVVVGALDELKRESARARDITRWLEDELRHGNRFLRAQRPGERLALPLIKYPKKKDKDAWAFFQVLECCAHLAKQAAAMSGNSQPGGATAALVTLLTGAEPTSKEFSPSGLAQSAGINLENVSSFCAKWKGKGGHG